MGDRQAAGVRFGEQRNPGRLRGIWGGIPNVIKLGKGEAVYWEGEAPAEPK